jgi:hypothetical protein
MADKHCTSLCRATPARNNIGAMTMTTPILLTDSEIGNRHERCTAPNAAARAKPAHENMEAVCATDQSGEEYVGAQSYVRG